MASQPLPAGLLATTKAAAFAPVVGLGDKPGRPKSSVPTVVPFLRMPMPAAPLLPSWQVLPVMFKQTVVSSPAVALPESTRMHWRAVPPALSGVVHVLLAILRFNEPLFARLNRPMSLPSVWLMLLLVTVMVIAGVELTPAPPAPEPPPIPIGPP